MANVKISALSAGTTPNRTEVLPAVQSAATVKFTVAQILGAIVDADIPATIARDAEVTTAVANAVAALVASAPATLDTLDELAAALGDDANYAATVTTALAGKSATGHGHAESDVTSLVADLAAKAAAVHTHAEADVTNLTTDLAAKVAASIVDAAGDLIVGTADNAVGRLGLGSALQVLRVNAAGTGLEYAAPAGGGGSGSDITFARMAFR